MLTKKNLIKSIENYINDLINNPTININEAKRIKKEKYIKKKIKEDIKNTMKNNSNYLSWLSGFIKKHGNFDTKMAYYYNNLTELDYINLKNFNLLFEIIYEYANKLKIKPNIIKKIGTDINYLIQYEDFYFKIGINIKQEAIYYCQRYFPKNEDIIINYKNINNKNKKLTKKRDC